MIVVCRRRQNNDIQMVHVLLKFMDLKAKNEVCTLVSLHVKVVIKDNEVFILILHVVLQLHNRSHKNRLGVYQIIISICQCYIFSNSQSQSVLETINAYL